MVKEATATKVKEEAQKAGIDEKQLEQFKDALAAEPMRAVEGILTHPFRHLWSKGFWHKIEGVSSLVGKGTILFGMGYGGYRGVKYLRK